MNDEMFITSLSNSFSKLAEKHKLIIFQNFLKSFLVFMSGRISAVDTVIDIFNQNETTNNQRSILLSLSCNGLQDALNKSDFLLGLCDFLENKEMAQEVKSQAELVKILLNKIDELVPEENITEIFIK